MIESITIANVATYSNPETLSGLSHFNFLFGSNGTGKTTVSRVIADEGKFPTCNVAWKGGTKLHRRILENYFKILGGVDPDKICAMFDGKEKLICKSLFSWVNDGSHFAHDDLYVSIDSSMVETYLKVFRAIFDKSEHSAHYRMMMGDAIEKPLNA